MHVDFNHPRIGRQRNVLQAIVVRRQVAFDHHRRPQFLRGGLDGREQFQVGFQAIERRQEDVQAALARFHAQGGANNGIEAAAEALLPRRRNPWRGRRPHPSRHRAILPVRLQRHPRRRIERRAAPRARVGRWLSRSRKRPASGSAVRSANGSRGNKSGGIVRPTAPSVNDCSGSRKPMAESPGIKNIESDRVAIARSPNVAPPATTVLQREGVAHDRRHALFQDPRQPLSLFRRTPTCCPADSHCPAGSVPSTGSRARPRRPPGMRGSTPSRRASRTTKRSASSACGRSRDRLAPAGRDFATTA